MEAVPGFVDLDRQRGPRVGRVAATVVVRAAAEPTDAGCSPYWLQECINKARAERDACDARTRGPGGGGPPGTGGPDPFDFCGRLYTAAVNTCQDRRGCPRGWTCQPDARPGSGGGWTPSGLGRCCPAGTLHCFNGCVPPCPFPKQLGTDSTCRCECPQVEVCTPPFTWDDDVCVCACQPTECVGGYIDPKTCRCICPPGLTLCKGRCVDLLRDEANCGRCGNQCTPGTQTCCNGRCTLLGTDDACRQCFDIPPGWKCCDRTPVLLGTDAHCADCAPCTDGRRCIDGSCQCPPGTRLLSGRCCPIDRQCCQHQDCPTGRRCCAGECVDTATNPKHCGDCGTGCSSPKECVNGTCQCPTGRQECGTTCCPPKGHCCNKKCCTVSQSCVDENRNVVQPTDPNGRCGCTIGRAPCFDSCCGAGDVCAGPNPWAKGYDCCALPNNVICPPTEEFPKGRCCVRGASTCCV